MPEKTAYISPLILSSVFGQELTHRQPNTIKKTVYQQRVFFFKRALRVAYHFEKVSVEPGFPCGKSLPRNR